MLVRTLVVMGLVGCAAEEARPPLPADVEAELLARVSSAEVVDGTGDTGGGEDLGISCGRAGDGYCCGIEWGGDVYFCCLFDGGGGACG